jgi:acetyl-CoA carboxylase biotin carboxyl carrier protein
METSKIRALMEIFNEEGLTALRVQDGDKAIEIERQPAPLAAAPLAVASARPADENATPSSSSPHPSPSEGILVRSPSVGMFYVAPSPDDPPYVLPGQEVFAGQTLCIVETMKMMNEVHAPAAGVIAEVLAANDTHVDYDQPLFRIESSEG